MMRQGWRLALPATLSVVCLLVVFFFCACDTTQQQRPLNADKNLHPDDNNNNNDQSPAVQASRRLLADVDAETLARYKAQPTGFRRHPAYYSDKYVKRAKPAVDNSFGSWQLVDTKRASRPTDDFYNQYPSRDVPWADFPDTAWQKDKEYLPKFLDEGIALVERALGAILAEYGISEESSGRTGDALYQLLGIQDGKGCGVVNANAQSYKGLIRRVMHAVVTEDTFVFAMSGHSAAAGHGNLFQQSYTHAYGAIMEPVFARLGVLSTSRNFGFGGLGTLQTGMATSDLMGPDIDILMWDSGMTEKRSTAPGVLVVQAILGGDRVPFYLGPGGYNNALFQGTGSDVGILAESAPCLKRRANTMEELEKLPFATKCLNFGPELKPVCGGNHYRGHCWVDRSDFEWGGMNMSYVPSKQVDQPGGRASWHPGDRVHQIKGRMLAGVVLNALRDGLLAWKNSTDLVLKDEDWHVADYYESVRNKTRTVFKDGATSWCTGQRIPARFCQVPVQGRTEFTPRYDPANKNLRNLIKATRSPYTPTASEYDPPDVYHPDLHPPEGELDVLAILESGVEFAPNLGRIRRRMALPPANNEVKVGGSSVDSKIVPGKGWSYQNLRVGTDMCDGEYDSWCKKGGTSCLMYSHNDDRQGLIFDGFSGWGVFELPNVREGLIVVKYHSWYPPNGAATTNGWTTENGEPAIDSRALTEVTGNEARRKLKKPPPPFCPEFKFEFAIDGKITSWNHTTWAAKNAPVQRVVEIATLLDDPDFTGGESKNVELAIRIRGCGRLKTFQLTHVYWA